jgi:hypothetical protein
VPSEKLIPLVRKLGVERAAFRAAVFILRPVSIGTLWPNQSMRATAETRGSGGLSKEQFEQLKSGKLILILVEDVSYQDRTMGKFHRSCLEAIYEPSIDAMTTRPCTGSPPDN